MNDLGHFLLSCGFKDLLMTGPHSRFSFLIDCHFFVFAIFPAALSDFLIMWQEFVRELSESNEIEQNVILRDLCHKFMCNMYSLKQCHRAVDY